MGIPISKFAMVRLSEYAEIKPGFAFKSDRFTENSADIPLVKGDNVQQGYIDWAKAKFWNCDDVDDYRDYLLDSGDIVVAMDRPWVNAGLKWAFIKPHDPKCLLVQRVARLRAKRGLSQGFLRYLVSSEYFASYIEPIVTGVNVPHISGKQIGDFRIPLPEIETQKKIAALLAAYDDLIENNKRRITLLENMAEEIYREWFVRFRFPGWQEAEFEKGSPKDWNYRKFRDLVAHYIGGGWGEDEQSAVFSEGAYVIRGTDIPKLSSGDFSPRIFRFHKPSNLKSRRMQECDFVFEASGGSKDQLLGRNLMLTSGMLSVFSNEVMCASFCKHIRFEKEKISPFFMKYFLKLFYEQDLVGIYQVQSTGISNYQFESFLDNQHVLVPEKSILERFNEVVEPIVAQLDYLALTNLKLEQTKAQLLPRLISGKLSVDNLDIEFPPSMQSDPSGSTDESAA